MTPFEIIAGSCSILSLFVSLFVASKIISIKNNVSVKGNKNTTSGRDTTITK